MKGERHGRNKTWAAEREMGWRSFEKKRIGIPESDEKKSEERKIKTGAVPCQTLGGKKTPPGPKKKRVQAIGICLTQDHKNTQVKERAATRIDS